MKRKTTITVIIIVAVLVLGIGIFLLFFTSPSIQTPTNTQNNNSPFGNYSGSSATSSASTNNSSNASVTQSGQTVQYINNSTSPLIKISTSPIAGAEAVDRKNGATTTPIVRYIERGNGHVNEYSRLTNILSTITNTTIPSIYQAWWSANTVLAQFIDQNKGVIKTFTSNLPQTSTTTAQIGQLSGGFLTDNIYALTISPKGNRVFTIAKGESTVGYISNLDGTKKTSILNFPFNEWSAEWPNENTITLTTKASFSASGFMYFLTTTGSMTKALGNIPGLTTRTSPDLANTIYSYSNTGGFATGIYNLSKRTTLAFTNTPTLPEKCVWSKLSKTTAYCAVPNSVPTASYPDDWYQGNVSFVDNIYKIDLSLPAVQLLYKLPTDQSIDAINLFLDAKEENLYFTNKSDYYLWGLTIKGLIPSGY